MFGKKKEESQRPVLVVGFENHMILLMIRMAKRAGVPAQPVANNLDVVLQTAIKEKAQEILISETGAKFSVADLKRRLRAHPATMNTNVRVVSMDAKPPRPWFPGFGIAKI